VTDRWREREDWTDKDTIKRGKNRARCTKFRQEIRKRNHNGTIN